MSDLQHQLSTSLRPNAVGRTHPGKLRQQNEDHVLVAAPWNVFVVADGMGGHTAGKIASTLACKSIQNFFEATTHSPQSMPPAAPGDEGLALAARRLVAAIRKANSDVFEISSGHEDFKGMGSTIVAVAVEGERVHIAHVGDSRCYRMRDGTLDQLTKDHSLINDALELKPNLTAAQLARLPKNVVTRALGMQDSVKLSLRTEPVQVGDTLLLCSDGLSGMVPDAQILDTLEWGDDLGETADMLVTMANEAGGRDNISVVLVRFEPSAGEPPSARRGEAPPVSRRSPQIVAAQTQATAVTESFTRDAAAQLTEYLKPSGQCRGCGHDLYEGNAFCTECGTPV